ncbi:hypothetical protein CH379_011585 [Leptospira ellisii]|uniref:Lipoprotein n=1 Tax=Leptospira ellisii TaxID=2023197 RepID=A0A2N0B5H1_9LEPT|nr:hypothetical protein [Leptospira ellisii]MDV6236266.1 hypothetical protein [Leptospira ellisii]PJZ91728.1 hypothetical protein CH379_17045 [Leptospira ellisii]PKA03531.1 hypothetical protein CH375_16405 [Leptospira ellisii]
MQNLRKYAKTAVLLSLVFGLMIQCKKEEDDIDPMVFLLAGLGSGYNCSATLGTRVAGLPAMDASTQVQTLVYGKVPFVNHSIAAVKYSGAANGDVISFTGMNVSDEDVATNAAGLGTHAPMVYNTANCPLTSSNYDTNRESYVTPSEGTYTGNGPFNYTLDTNSGRGNDYYFIFYLADRTNEPPTTTFQITVKN